ncbi:MAG: biotin--[Clostridia bacterium]|nr:biotin--[acetyl-CoA-carboxylase] ligase [Clostridia bacterium]
MQLINLETKILGRKLDFFDELDSTQSEVWRLIKNNTIKNGEMVVANIQTAGVGTHGRKWYTDQPNNIAISMYVETNCKAEKIEGITLKIADILKSVFYRLYDINLDIKEPNDLYYNNKKIGGILTESKIAEGKSKFLVVGIGVNTSQAIFNNEISEIAGSIKNEFGIDIDNEAVIAEFCNNFEKFIMDLTERNEI